MDESELRSWVGEKLGRDVPDAVWSLLRDDGFLNVSDDNGRDDLARRAARLLQVFSSKSMQHRRARVVRSGEASQKPALSAYESERALAMSEYYAKYAASLPEVRAFRHDVLGGHLLSEQDARGLLNSSAARMLTPVEFERHGIPLVHDSEVLSQDYVRGERYCAVLSISPPNVQVEFEHLLKDVGTFWEGMPGNYVLEFRLKGMRHETTVFNGSVLDRLRRTATTLQPLPWQKGDATWFVLTGERPRTVPMQSNSTIKWSSFANSGQIELQIEPWVSAASVAAMYKKAQRRFLGRENRPISARRLALFRLVTSETDENLEIPSWRVLMDEWNARYPAWTYKNVRNFARDYWSALRFIMFPDYTSFLQRLENQHG
ncbi:MAG: hypothetical protein WEB52_13620 [Dehalococcoidia bacterium]